MIKHLHIALLLFGLWTPGMASNMENEQQPVITTVLTLKSIIYNKLNENQARSELNRIPSTKPFVKEGRYTGHKLFEDGKLIGLLSVRYQNKIPVMAAYSTVPLKVRHATSMYKDYRETLQGHYKEDSFNHFDIGDGIIAELSKKQRSLSIFVYRR